MRADCLYLAGKRCVVWPLTLAIVVVQIIVGVEGLDLVCRLVQAGEPVNGVGAEHGIEVLNVELAVPGPVDRPGAIVTGGQVVGAGADHCPNDPERK